ncbi:MAG: phenylacetate--CoA ligase family protein [Crocinitomicaceae bacterium]|nr:phenylacetate--CoA ligase family protein [Crocinitomicaceae bacterium]
MNWIFKLSFVLQGFPIAKAIEEFNQLLTLSDEQKLAVQQKKAWSIFEHHKKNNSHYNNFIGDSSVSNWNDIPILKKSDIQVPLEQRLTSPFTKKEVFLNNTSGSSGTPFYFAKDKYCHAMAWASSIYRFGQHGVVFGKSKQARFYGIPACGKKYYKEKLKDFLSGRVRIPVFDLSEKKLFETQELFANTKFQNVNGYTSSLVLFAKHLIKQGVTAKQICPTLEVVFPTSEVCDDLDRATLEKGFGVKVVNEYGASELDLIAFEDVDGDWMVNNETLLVEIVDENGKEVPNGIEGKVVVTSLYNKAMPFVRYELGDMAIKSSRKKGAYTILEKVTGRTNDFVYLPSGKVAAGLTFYYISKALMDQGDDMKEFIIKQIKIDEFLFEYVSDQELSPEQKMNVQKALETYLEPGLTALFERKETIERTKAGKLKHFHSMLQVGTGTAQ